MRRRRGKKEGMQEGRTEQREQWNSEQGGVEFELRRVGGGEGSTNECAFSSGRWRLEDGKAGWKARM